MWRPVQPTQDLNHTGRSRLPTLAHPSGAVCGHSRFHLGLFITGVIVRKLHVEHPLHEEDGVGVEVQLAAGLPHHRVVGVGIQKDRDVPAAHQHLRSGQGWGEEHSRAQHGVSGVEGLPAPGAGPTKYVTDNVPSSTCHDHPGRQRPSFTHLELTREA